MTEINTLTRQTSVLDSVKDGENTISPINRPEKIIGLCSTCYSSGKSLVLDEESGEAICDSCKK